MITTRIDPPLLSPSFETVVLVDTTEKMLGAAVIWGNLGLAIFSPIVDDEYAMAIGNLRDLCIKFFQEIRCSDAKKPKALMQGYLGIDSLPVDEDFEGFGLCVDLRDMIEGEQKSCFVQLLAG